MILFRVDGNQNIGIGHIMRCMSVAKAASERGIRCLFVTSGEEPVELINSNGYEAEVLNTDYSDMESEIDKLLLIVEKYSPKAILYDSFFLREDYIKRIRSQVSGDVKIAVIDDACKYAFACDVIIHYAVDEEIKRQRYEEIYELSGVGLPSILAGVRYAPIRGEFRKHQKTAINERIKDVLFLSGGSDIGHITLRFMQEIKERTESSDYVFYIAIGAMCSDKEQIYDMSEGMSNIRIYENYDKMWELMSDVDFAITAGGVTLMELCACGTPCGVYFFVDNQLPTEILCKAIPVPCLGDIRNDEKAIEKMFQLILDMDEDEAGRRSMSERQRQVVDGCGAERIVDELLRGDD